MESEVCHTAEYRKVTKCYIENTENCMRINFLLLSVKPLILISKELLVPKECVDLMITGKNIIKVCCKTIEFDKYAWMRTLEYYTK